jgi:hypothetical protein
MGETPMNDVSSFHLVPHLKECSLTVAMNCDKFIIFWELHGTFLILTIVVSSDVVSRGEAIM